MPRQEVTVTLIKQFKYPKAVFAQGKVTDNEAKRLALADMTSELNVNVGEEQFDAFMINDGTYSLKNSSLTLKSNHVGSIARILAQEEIEQKYGPLDPITNAKIYKFDGDGNPFLKRSIDDEMQVVRNNFEDRLHRALFVDAGMDPRASRRTNSAIERLQEELRQRAQPRPITLEDTPRLTENRWYLPQMGVDASALGREENNRNSETPLDEVANRIESGEFEEDYNDEEMEHEDDL